MSITLPLCFGEYVLFKGKNIYTLSEGKIINSLQGLLNNLEKLTYGSYLCELIDICLTEEDSNRDLFKDFVSALYLINTDAVDNEIICRAFELKVLKATGYSLDLDNCTLCRKKINTSNYINLLYYGGICEDCDKSGSVKLSKSTYNALKFLNSIPIEKAYRVSLSEEIKEEIEKITSLIISSNYSRKPKSLDMLEIFKGGK